MTVQRRNGAVFDKVAYVEELLEGETMCLAQLRIGTHVVELAEPGCKFDMTSVVEAGARELDHAVLSTAQDWVLQASRSSLSAYSGDHFLKFLEFIFRYPSLLAEVNACHFGGKRRM